MKIYFVNSKLANASFNTEFWYGKLNSTSNVDLKVLYHIIFDLTRFIGHQHVHGRGSKNNNNDKNKNKRIKWDKPMYIIQCLTRIIIFVFKMSKHPKRLETCM